MKTLTDFEMAVLRKLLSGDHHVLAILRQQLEVCRVSKRETTGVGVYVELDASAHPGARLALDLKFGDVIAEIEGLEHGAGFLLYVEAGLMVMLEGYTFGETWPERVDRYELRYVNEGNRDRAIAKLLGDCS